MDKLRECPFCGARARLNQQITVSTLRRVACSTCYARTKQCRTEADAITAWNRRPKPANEPLTLEQLRERAGKPVWVANANTPELSGWYLIRAGDKDFFAVAVDGWKIPLDCLGDRLAYDHPPKEESQ